MILITLLLRTRFFCISGLRKSRYLYFSRVSSLSSSLSMSKGKGGHLVYISSSDILISTVPAGEFSFCVPSGRGFTFPVNLIEDSLERDFAVSKFVSSFAVVSVWTVPVMSLISKKINLPCSLIVSTQPLISTCCPSIEGRSLIIVLSIVIDVNSGL